MSHISVVVIACSDAKFQEDKSYYLGQLIVTPEIVAKKIKAVKDNKSPGVDGIPPKLLMETALFIKGSINKSEKDWILFYIRTFLFLCCCRFAADSCARSCHWTQLHHKLVTCQS